MYSMALWFWSTVALSGFVLAGLAGTASFAVPRVVASFRDHAERVSRPSLAHHFHSILPSNPSHPSNPRPC